MITRLELAAERVGDLAQALLGTLPESGSTGRVESVYRNAVNIAYQASGCRGGEAGSSGGGRPWSICLLPAGTPLHSHALTVAAAGCGPAFLDACLGERVLLARRAIEFGDCRLSIALGGAGVWDSRLRPPAPGGTRRALTMLEVVWDVVIAEVAGGRADDQDEGSRGCGEQDRVRSQIEGAADSRTYCLPVSPFLGAMAQARTRAPASSSGSDVVGAGTIAALMRARATRLLRGMEAVCEAEAPADRQASYQAELAGRLRPVLGEILGFGPGLTPSGDDFLLGLLAAARAFGAGGTGAIEAEVAGLLADAAATAPTTGKSLRMLTAAIRGHFPEPVTDLVAALGQTGAACHTSCSGRASATSAPGVREATRRLLALGSTSGQDMLAGMVFWLETCHESRLEPTEVGAS